MTTDGAPGDGPVERRTIPMPRTGPDDLRDDDTQELPPVRDDAGEPAVGDTHRAAAPEPGDGDPAFDEATTDETHVDGAGATPPRGIVLPAVPAPPVAGFETTRVYADGSALSRYLAGAPAREAWLAWAGEHEAELVTTPLGLSELRRIAQPRGLEARGAAVDVGGRIEVARFSDQTLRKASKVSAVLPPFVALHLGAALAHPGVTTVATYDRQLAQVAALYGLVVVSPGWPDRWWERDA